MNVPALESERLSFSGHRPGDFDECAAMWGDPAVTRHIGGVPSSSEEVWARLLRYVGHWDLLGFGYWVVREKASGRFVGEVGFADFKRLIEPRLDAPEMGWVLAPWAHGRGFATEAVRAAMGWGRSNLPVPRTVCIIDPGNAASIRVARKCGFVEIGSSSYKGHSTLLFRAAL
jgi:RimJ/RimL family protein N-acetyltransferase